MQTKVLTKEYCCTLSNGSKLYYATPNENNCEVITLTVRGLFTPIEDKRDYRNESIELTNMFRRNGDRYLTEQKWIEPYYIFQQSITERGICYNKFSKYMYRLYIRTNTNKSTLSEYVESIITLTEGLNDIFEEMVSECGFKTKKTT